MKIKSLFTFIFLCFCMSTVHAVETQPKEFAEAVEILHTYGGNGSQIKDAIDIANKLAISHPNKGYEQTIYAEIYSTFKLSQTGKPIELRDYIIDITSEAIKLNPKLAQAYVARARTYLRSHELEKTRLDVDKALELDPTLSGAAFIKADFYRKTHQIEDAVKWYKKFIELADSTKRKANGYYWIARTYQVIRYHDNKANKHNIERTSKYYRKSLELSPNNPWGNVDYAIFLNGYGEDYIAAEQYAKKALDLMNFKMARYHLAIARYLQLLKDIDKPNFALKAEEVYKSTSLSPKEIIKFLGGKNSISRKMNKISEALEAMNHSKADAS